MLRTLMLCLWLPLCASSAWAQHGLEPIDLGAFGEKLQSEDGVAAHVHGVDPATGLYVMVYREDSFFRYIHFPVIADRADPDFDRIQAMLNSLARHDAVRVRGRFHPRVVAPMEHVLLSELTLVERYEREARYRYETTLPDDLVGKEEALFKVHAVLEGGEVFVVEYGDVNLPFLFARPELTRDLYRGDLVNIRFRIAPAPRRPPHLVLDDTPDAIEVVDRLVDQHGEIATRCGTLAMFPQSPQVVFDVFAIRFELTEGYSRNYTLLPEELEDREPFERLRARLQEVWQEHRETVEPARNHLVNPAIEVCATGRINMVDRNQANPQIFLGDLDDLQTR